MDIKDRISKLGNSREFILLLIIAGFSIPYFLLMIEIQRAAVRDFTFWPLAILRILLYSLFSPLVFIITLSIVRKYNLLAKLYSLIYVSSYFISLIIILIYFKYFATIPQITLLNSMNLGSMGAFSILIGLVYNQLLGFQEWFMILLFFVTILLIYKFLRLAKTKEIKGYIKFSTLLLVLLTYYGLYEIQIYRYRNYFGSNSSWLGRTSEAVLYFGLTPVYNKLLKYKIFHKKTPLPYPGKINKQTQRNDKIPRFKDANVIIVQVESLDSLAVDLRINGKPIMPFLQNLKSRTVYFENFFAQHSGGASTDADLSLLTSLLPVPHQVGLYTAKHNLIKSLVEVLEQKAYKSLVMSSVSFVFQDKTSAYPKLGFDHFYDSNFYSGSATGWYSMDLAFFKQSVQIIKNSSKPFFVYLLTHQSHGPFKNYSESTRKDFNFENTDFSNLEIDYLMSMNEVDTALEYFFHKILESGILNNTILIIYGDHSGHALSDPDCLAECVPLFIYQKSLPPKVETKVGSHLDLAPTVLDLLDIPEPVGWLGTSLFAEGRRVVLLNDLTSVEVIDGVPKRKVAMEYQPYLEYSASLVE
ncbi:MAG: LTA synthase family protein [Thermodesulfobacteriota bacterium]